MSIEAGPSPKKEKKPHKMEDTELSDEIAALEKRIAENERAIKEKVEQRRKAMPEKLRERAEQLQGQVETKRKKLKEAEGKESEQKDRVRTAFAKMSPKEFAEFAPKRFLFGKRIWVGLPIFGGEDILGKYFGDFDFMRYATGEQYMAVMESERFSEDEKERITEARFRF